MAKFAAHELLEAHELLTAKNLSVQKGYTYLQMVKDPDLKDLIKTGISDCKQAVTQLQQVLGGI
ncbi:MAG: spore coat protein [Bacillota bacterium]